MTAAYSRIPFTERKRTQFSADPGNEQAHASDDSDSEV